MSAQQRIPLLLRLAVWRKNDGHCAYCFMSLSYKMMHVDHVIPRKRGGSNAFSNLLPACPTCNSSKGARRPHEWRTQRQIRAERLRNRKPRPKPKPKPKKRTRFAARRYPPGIKTQVLGTFLPASLVEAFRVKCHAHGIAVSEAVAAGVHGFLDGTIAFQETDFPRGAEPVKTLRTVLPQTTFRNFKGSCLRQGFNIKHTLYSYAQRVIDGTITLPLPLEPDDEPTDEP